MLHAISIISLVLVAPTLGDDSIVYSGEQAGKDSVIEGDLLLEEIVRILGTNFSGEQLQRSAEKDLPELETALRPMVATLPLNENKKLGSAAVRYTLHRLLVNQHGWFFVGLENEGQAWNSSSPTDVTLLDKLPEDIREVVDARLQGPGLVIREIAVLAAVLEHLVHMEADQRLAAVYRKLSLQEETTGHQAQYAIQVYMAAYILGRDPSVMTWRQLVAQYDSIDSSYPTWPKTQAWMQGIVERQVPVNASKVHLSDATRAIEELGRNYWQMHSTQCQYMKGTLMRMEDRGTGRVRMQDFYGMALHEGKWQFAESVAYLRELGALDDSNPGNLRVIIPNYVDGLSNCIASSEYYSVCCISECEGIMGQLENTLGVPEASPQEIASLIKSMPSSTVAKPSISPLMLHRLNAIAAKSDSGKVPLHGRLFTQWLHHIYPRECAYPHLSGTTSPTQLEEWMKVTGLDPTASPETMKEYAGSTEAQWRSEVNFTGPIETPAWSYEEELFVQKALPEEHPFELHAALHGVVFAAFAAIMSLGIVLMRTARETRKALRNSNAAMSKGKSASTFMV